MTLAAVAAKLRDDFQMAGGAIDPEALEIIEAFEKDPDFKLREQVQDLLTRARLEDWESPEIVVRLDALLGASPGSPPAKTVDGAVVSGLTP